MGGRSPDGLTAHVGRLYDRHGAALYRYALMLLADASGAEDAVQQVQMLEEFLNTARQPWPEKLQVEAPTESEIVARRSSSILPRLSDWNIGNRAINRYVNARRTEAAASTLALVRSALAATAVARFRLAHAGQLPRTLEDLVPEFLPAVPVDPYSGKSLRYAQDAARFAIYSDGTNKRDDGGKGLNGTTSRRWGVYSVTPAPLDIGVEVSTLPAAVVVPVPPLPALQDAVDDAK